MSFVWTLERIKSNYSKGYESNNCVKNPRDRMSPALVSKHLNIVFEISFKRYLFL